MIEGDILDDHDDRFPVAGYLFEPEYTDEELRDREVLHSKSQERLADPLFLLSVCKGLECWVPDSKQP